MRKLTFSARSRPPIALIDSAASMTVDLSHPQLQFIQSVAKQYAQRGVSFAELVQAGLTALIHAEQAASEQPDKAVKRKRQATTTWRVREAMLQKISERSI